MAQILSTNEKKKILDFVANDFSQQATKQNWVSHYDKDSDSYALHEPKLLDVQKRYINDEFAFYLDKDSNVKGIFIEYFTTNLISHHEENFSEIRNDIEEQEAAVGKSVIELGKDVSNRIVSGLETLMLDSMIQSMPRTA